MTAVAKAVGKARKRQKSGERPVPRPRPKVGRGHQFAALPFKVSEGETSVMLVTSRETGRWILPKGWAEKALTGPQLAAKEAFEEAGIVGNIDAASIGWYSYLKQMPRGPQVECKVTVFPLRVERLLDEWPERQQRARAWFTLSEAALVVTDGELVALLLRLAAPDP